MRLKEVAPLIVGEEGTPVLQLYAHMHVCTHTYIHTHIYIHTHTHTHTHTIYIYIYTYTYIHIHTYTHRRHEVQGMRLKEVAPLIVGEEGTPVRIGVQKQDSDRVVYITLYRRAAKKDDENKGVGVYVCMYV
jgi:hypothetical protein